MHSLAIILHDRKATTDAEREVEQALSDIASYTDLIRLQTIYNEAEQREKITQFIDSDYLLRQYKNAYQGDTSGVEFLNIIIRKLTSKALKKLLPKKMQIKDDPALLNARVDLYIRELVRLFDISTQELPRYSISTRAVIKTFPYQYFSDINTTNVTFMHYLMGLHPLTDNTTIDKFSEQIELHFDQAYTHKKMFRIEKNKVLITKPEMTEIELLDSPWADARKLQQLKSTSIELYRLTVIVSDRLQKMVEQALVLYNQIEANSLSPDKQAKAIEQMNRLQIYSTVVNATIMTSKRNINLIVHSILGPLITKALPNNDLILYRY